MLDPETREGRLWKETAMFHYENEMFYRHLLVQIGEAIGEAAYIADDGSRPGGVLVAKLPDLVRAMAASRAPVENRSDEPRWPPQPA